MASSMMAGNQTMYYNNNGRPWNWRVPLYLTTQI
jgi:hypothetical protein